MLAGVFYAAAALLVIAGVQKAIDPKPLVRALKSVAVRVPAPVVRALAAAEAAIGLHALVTGRGLLVALSYSGFTAFVLLALARGGVLSSCGCFGKADTPPTMSHAVVTAGLAVASAPGADGHLPLDVALLTTTAAVALTSYLVMAVLPLVRAR